VADIRIAHYDAAGANTLRETIADIHRDAYSARISSGDPFASPESFMRRFDSHARNASFGFVIADVGDEAVGQAWGFPQAPTFGDLPGGLPDDPAIAGLGFQEGEQVFGLCEIMVRQAWTGQGIAHRLHDALLAGRPERFAELYVRPDNARACRAYLKWGWCKVGEKRPDLPGAPLFDVLVLPLAG